MAKVQFGMIVTDMRNKLGGHVFTKNRGGSTVRTKVTPANPQTTYQSGIRQIFTALSQGWRSLTADQRNAWNAAVSSFQRTDIFGNLRTPSGINLYQRLNNVLVQVGVAALTSPPLPEAVADCYVASITAAVGTPALSVTLNETIPANTSLMLFATSPQSAGRNFVKSQFRLIAVLPAAETSPYDALTKYTAKFGDTGQVGQKIFVKTVAVNTNTGQQGASAIASVITTA